MSDQCKWPDKAKDVLQIAFAAMPQGIDKAPAYGLKDPFGDNYAIELPAHIVVAVKATHGMDGVGACVAIPQDAITNAERLGYDMIVYVHNGQKYYLTNVSNIKGHYTTIISRGQSCPAWVMPIKRLTEYTQAKADKMQGVLLL